MQPKAFVLLLFSGVASALQLCDEGYASASNNFTLLPTKLFNMVPRGLPMANYPKPGQTTLHHGQCMPSNILTILKARNEKIVPIENEGGSALIFRIKPGIFSDYPKSLIVKVVTIGGRLRPNPTFPSSPDIWTEDLVKDEIDVLKQVHQLIGGLKDGNDWYILMKDMGRKWSELRGQRVPNSRTWQRIKEAEELYARLYAIQRRLYTLQKIDAYVFRWPRDGRNMEANLVGEWRYAKSTGSKPEKPVDPEQHYCGMP